VTASGYVARVAMQVSRNVVFASIQVELDEDVIRLFQEDLLERLHSTGARGVILDVSGLETLDSEEFRALRRIIAMARIMGAESVIVGLRPGVVSALIETGADVDGLRGARNLDAAYRLFEPGEAPPEAPPEADADAAEPGAGADPGSAEE